MEAAEGGIGELATDTRATAARAASSGKPQGLKVSFASVVKKPPS